MMSFVDLVPRLADGSGLGPNPSLNPIRLRVRAGPGTDTGKPLYNDTSYNDNLFTTIVSGGRIVLQARFYQITDKAIPPARSLSHAILHHRNDRTPSADPTDRGKQNAVDSVLTI